MSKRIAALGACAVAAAAGGTAVQFVRGFRAFRRGFVPVLLYHSLSADPSARHDYIVRRKAFGQQMRWLARAGYETTMCKGLLRDGAPVDRPGRKLVAITFDDGFASTHALGLPVLRGLGMSATLFAAADHIQQALPFPWPYAREDPPLSTAQVRELVAVGFEIGAHSCTHPDLRSLNDEALQNEIAGCGSAIQAWTGTAPPSFAYPFGLFDRRVQNAVATAGYTAAFAVFTPPEEAGQFAMPRILVRNQTSMLGFRLRVSGVHPYLKTRRWFRLVRPLLRRQRWAFW